MAENPTHTQMCHKPLLSLGWLSFCGILIYSHGTLSGEGEARIGVGNFFDWLHKNAPSLHSPKDAFPHSSMLLTTSPLVYPLVISSCPLPAVSHFQFKICSSTTV